MGVSFETSKTGRASCRAGDFLLHSAYDPEKEAERFLSQHAELSQASIFVLLGPSLDYLSPAIRRLRPKASIISIQFSSDFKGREIGHPDSCWYPDDCQTEGLEAFLERQLDGDRLAGLCILPWPPAAKAFPLEFEAANLVLRAVLDREASSAATLKAYGRRWFLNACRSFLFIEDCLLPWQDDAPVVMAAAGPSLEASLAALKPFRQRFRLFAVSSALAACRAAGLDPDLTIATDGGVWSRLHLYPLAAKPVPLAAPLVALPSSGLWPRTPILLIEQGNFPEAELCSFLGPRVRLPSHGTVSGTALRLAAGLTTGPILAAGLDLASLDLRSHARPHGFDSFGLEGQTCLHPQETAAYSRERPLAPERIGAGPWWTSRSLRLYARALSAEAGELPLAGRVFRLNASAVRLGSMREIGEKDLDSLLPGREDSGRSVPARSPVPPSDARRDFLESRFAAWRKDLGEAIDAINSGSALESPRMKELFRAVDFPDWAAASRALASGENAGAALLSLEREVKEFLDEAERKLLSYG